MQNSCSKTLSVYIVQKKTNTVLCHCSSHPFLFTSYIHSWFYTAGQSSVQEYSNAKQCNTTGHNLSDKNPTVSTSTYCSAIHIIVRVQMLCICSSRSMNLVLIKKLLNKYYATP